jgi:hypothetical protein
VILQTLAAEPSPVGIEVAGFQLSAWQDVLTAEESRGRVVKLIRLDRDKVARAQPWIARAEAGRVALVRGAWIAAFLDEACNFPEGAHDDQVDAVSGVVGMLTSHRAPADVGIDPEPVMIRPGRQPLFARGRR